MSADFTQIHTLENVEGENVERENLKVHSKRECAENLEKVKIVKVKKEIVDTDSDDVIITFVEHGFPKEVKKEPHLSSTTKQSMKLTSTDSHDKEYQCRIEILAEVHRPQRDKSTAIYIRS